MPLVHSGSRAAIGQNIREMQKTHPHAQAVAAALATADRYAKRRAAGGSAGAPAVAPTAPTYQTAATGILPSGLMPVPQTGSYQMDPNTGALTPATQAALQSFAQRGLPISGTATTSAASAPASSSPLVSVLQDSSNNNGGPGKRGGRPEHFANGGVPTSAEMAPWYVRSEARGMDHAPGGLIHTGGPGRTDNVPMSVAAGSHVVPADVVSGLGEGSSLAGAHAMDMAMHTGPGGISLPRGPARSTIPRPPSPPKFARGGKTVPQWEGHELRIARGGAANGVKCIVAGGEWIIRPDEVQRVRYKGKTGHDAIDAWIVDMRHANIKKLRTLPGPVK